MSNKSKLIRLAVAGSLFVAIMLVYVVRLAQLQLVQGEAFRNQVDSTYTSKTTLTAARGEITDRYGRSLATNKTVNNIIFQKAYLPADETNQMIRRLCDLMEEWKEEWIDNLPLTAASKAAPLTFTKDSDSRIKILKNFLGLATYATAQNCLDALRERFDIPEDWTDEEARRVVGVRYEMERTGFSHNLNYTFAQDITNETLIQVKEMNYELKGVNVEQKPMRVYVSGDLIPHAIGTIGPIYAEESKELLAQGYSLNDQVGKSGIESWAEYYLRGTNGVRSVTRTKTGEVLYDEVTKEPVAGGTVTLTIDADFQRFAQDALNNGIAHIKKTYRWAEEMEGGALVVLNAKTFEVLAQATYPNYDINTYLTDYASLLEEEYRPLFNRATAGVYTPGSIFKPCVAAISLNEGVITPSSTVSCQRVYRYFPDYQPTCMGYHSGINVIRAIQESCNIFFYDTGRVLGIDKMSSGATDYFGFGSPTGIQIYEEKGRMSSPALSKTLRGETWVPGNTIQAAIGQMDTAATPVQLATYAATLANNGVRKQVSIVKDVRSSADATKVLWKNEQKVLSTFPNKNKALETVKEGMVACSRRGSASTFFRNYKIDVATKTGSPQISTTASNGTFIGFAPADDPQIAFAIVGEKMTHGYVLGQIAKDLCDYYFDTRQAGENMMRPGELLGE